MIGDVMPTDLNDVTQVELLWIEKRIENRIRFGHIIHQTILDGRRRRVSFAPGSIFAFVRWASNEYGTVVSRIHILYRPQVYLNRNWRSDCGALATY